ncbi:hypothetical protein HBA55_04970 [Pseudomaricurvus alkylphenolicus]|uniref:Zn-ribbon domain-containing OB-fold protein n=1 Tax=Pseudomaricurvus alkylphenolicus TaxID=1306991 RepID=UPI001422651A|nr:OB-fold domain-containing protein [Pseudomaricurvus alkylphenolicus]NIB38926.1 hypothetical protein [Pseudomaricurvus alkylphenolicus]
MTTDWLLPELDELTRPFWDACKRGQLQLQRCRTSGRLLHPPRWQSPWDPGNGEYGKLDWVTVCGRGTIWTKAVPHPPLLPPFSQFSPYNVIIVALEEDPRIRMIGNLVARPQAPINSVAPTEIEIGSAVRVVFEKISDDFHFPRWVLDTRENAEDSSHV